eukprot:SAG22_NODE_11526_length_480_cov_1.304462_1_plen_104_part_01
MPTTAMPTRSRPADDAAARRLRHLASCAACSAPLPTRPVAAHAAATSAAAAGRRFQWQPILTQDRQLQVVSGSTEAAAAAVQRGAEMRLFMTTDTHGTFYEEVM